MGILNGNRIPAGSGHNETSVLGNAYMPFGEMHMESGVFHNVSGPAQSGIIRFNPYANGLEGSDDGGLTWFDMSAGTGAGVDSIGVLGDANLTGAVDLATKSSGFMVIEDTTNASPLIFSVNTLGLSGLWDFPTQGFNGSIVNGISQIGATNLQGQIDFQTVSSGFMSITQTGQNIQWGIDQLALSGLWGFPTAGFTNMVRGYTNTYSAATSWTITHSLNTENVSVDLYDNSGNPLKLDADDIEITDADNVTVTWNSSQAGKAVVFGF